jgi:large subunit ribosomal protein L4
MPEVPLFDGAGTGGNTVALSDAVFGGTPNRALLHQAVLRQLADARQGTHDTMTRGEVSYTTAKWYRQKGTGRARLGARFKAPHHIHGGVAHGPHPRSYRQGLPRKMRVAALRSALAAKAGEGQVSLVDGLAMDTPSTKGLARLLAAVAPGQSTLLLLSEPQSAVQLSARNLPGVTATTTESLNVLDILRHERLVLTLDAARRLEARFGGAEPAQETQETEARAEAAAPAGAAASASSAASDETMPGAFDETIVPGSAAAPATSEGSTTSAGSAGTEALGAKPAGSEE